MYIYIEIEIFLISCGNKFLRLNTFLLDLIFIRMITDMKMIIFELLQIIIHHQNIKFIYLFCLFMKWKLMFPYLVP